MKRTDHNVQSAVLVVIPCYNEEAYIERLVTDIVNAPCLRPLKIVIADGASRDRTRQIAEALTACHHNVIYLSNPKQLQSSAVNIAVAAYGQDAEFLIRLDAHASYPPNYLQSLIEDAEITGADSVVVAMETVGQGRFQSAVAAAQNSRIGNGGAAHRCVNHAGAWVDHGHHALMRIDSFKAVGGYDETFSHNEDAELDIRLLKSGFRIWLTDRTFLRYYPRSSPVSLFRQYLKYGQGRVRTIQKHHVRPKLRQIAPAAVVPASCLVLASPVTLAALLPFAGWVALCLTYGMMLGLRARRLSLILAGPAALIMHLGWSIGFWQALVFRVGTPVPARPVLARPIPARPATDLVQIPANDIVQTEAARVSG